MPPRPRTRTAARGFTLIELLVALAVMALMSAMGWQALAGMQRALEVNRNHNDAVLTVEAGLHQWGADLDAVQDMPLTVALEWDGRALRLTRRNTQPYEGVLVVAWTRAERNGQGQWVRWQSAPVQTREAWQAAWDAAALWAQGAGASAAPSREVAVGAIDAWQLFFFRGGAWSNPLSSVGAQESKGLPDGVRLVLTLPTDHPLSGTVVRDWARNTLSGSAP